MYTHAPSHAKIITGSLIVVFCFILALYSYAQRHPITQVAQVDKDTDMDDAPHAEQLTANVLNFDNGSLAPIHYDVKEDTPQFVILSFDGSKSVDMLDETLDFQQKMALEGRPINFTYFINGAYLLTKENAGIYTAPHQSPGTSNIGFSNNAKDISKRISTFNQALKLGDEIGSHTVGHYDGSSWTYAEWKQEFDSFNSVLADVRKNNPGVYIENPKFSSETIIGFRAPQLGVNNNLYKVLGDFNFKYDTSEVGRNDKWPVKDENGVWRIPLGTINLKSTGSKVVAMDYSIWMHQSQAQEVARKGDLLWQNYYHDVLDGFNNYFNSNYNGNRAPVVIGGHFSKWNDGVYWEAMKTFAENVCGKKHVRCVTFSTLVNYLDTQGVPKII